MESGRRDGSRIAGTSKMERFVMIVNDFRPLTIVTKRSILDVAAALDPPLGRLLLSINFTVKCELVLSELRKTVLHRGFILKPTERP